MVHNLFQLIFLSLFASTMTRNSGRAARLGSGFSRKSSFCETHTKIITAKHSLVVNADENHQNKVPYFSLKARKRRRRICKAYLLGAADDALWVKDKLYLIIFICVDYRLVPL